MEEKAILQAAVSGVWCSLLIHNQGLSQLFRVIQVGTCLIQHMNRFYTQHTEAVEITFDPAIISYEQLVDIYWQQTDPTDAFGQFQDRGDNYQLFYRSQEQKKLLRKVKNV